MTIKKFYTSLVIAFGILTATTSNAQNKELAIDKLLKEYFLKGEINGTVLVAERDSIIYSKAFGLANFEWQIPNQTTSKFTLYSISKQFTALLVLQFVAEGKLKLEDTISKYLPDYRKDIAERVTIHQLLSNTSGIKELDIKDFPAHNSLLLDESIQKYFSNNLEFEPGSKFKYSGFTGYLILASILEKITGKKYEALLDERIFNPLGMKNTGYFRFKKVLKNLTYEYKKVNDNYIIPERIYIDDGNGGAGLYSTSEDLFLWNRALYTEKLLPQEYINLMYKKHIPAYEIHYSYGYYVFEQEWQGEKKKIIYHGGSNQHLILRNLTDRKLIVLLNNVEGIDTWEISRQIMKILYDYDL